MTDDNAEEFVGFEEKREPDKTDEQRQREAIERLNEVEQLRALLELEPLRDFLWRLLAKCHVFTSIYSKSYGEMAFLEGERNIGLWLGKEITTANAGAFRLMREKAEAAENAERRRALERAAGLNRPPSSQGP